MGGPLKLCQRYVQILGDLRAQRLPNPCLVIGDLRPLGQIFLNFMCQKG